MKHFKCLVFVVHFCMILGSKAQVDIYFNKGGSVSPHSIAYKSEQKLYFTLLDSNLREQIYYINRNEVKSCEASIGSGLDNADIHGTIFWDQIKAQKKLDNKSLYQRNKSYIKRINTAFALIYLAPLAVGGIAIVTDVVEVLYLNLPIGIIGISSWLSGIKQNHILNDLRIAQHYIEQDKILIKRLLIESAEEPKNESKNDMEVQQVKEVPKKIKSTKGPLIVGSQEENIYLHPEYNNSDQVPMLTFELAAKNLESLSVDGDYSLPSSYFLKYLSKNQNLRTMFPQGWYWSNEEESDENVLCVNIGTGEMKEMSKAEKAYYLPILLEEK